MNAISQLHVVKQRCAVFVLMVIAGTWLPMGPAQAQQGPFITRSPIRALQQAHWVAEGSAHPRHVIYVFDDPNCPYCHKLWLALQAYHQHAGLQVRNVLVGVIAASSPGKTAAIFSARHPVNAWRENEQRWGTRSDGGGGIAPVEHIKPAVRRAIRSNEQLMRSFGIRGTPGIVYVDAFGKVHVRAGVPGKAALDDIVQTAVGPVR